MSKYVKYNIYMIVQNIVILVNLFLTIFVYKDEKFIISMSMCMPMAILSLSTWQKRELCKHYKIHDTHALLSYGMFFILVSTMFVLMILYSLKVNFMPYLFQILSVPLNIYVIAFSIAIKKDSKE